ncbi:MAG: L-histidine N(alpha)-methyltransferase [Candidatus Nitrosopelagicus sp.]|nr:MAG: L-histidine N(alpha)-methyltransferase [Candidatus Nitrosopelagicus sp.]
MTTESKQELLGYQSHSIQKNLKYFKPTKNSTTATFAEEIRNTLQHSKKSISPKFFYDESGSKLFDEICLLPEYYPYNAETEILDKIEQKLLPYLSEEFHLVELGSGSSVKTRLLIDVLLKSQKYLQYFPIDISEILDQSAKNLCKDYPNLSVTGVVDTFENGLDFIENYDNKPNLITFLGSSFGNFDKSNGITFLKKISSLMKSSDLFLIGLDLKKDQKILHNAYNDAQNTTAKFNLNVLKRINAELGANFDIKKFEHHAIYNEEKGRIEMYLRSLSEQSVSIPKSELSINLLKDELIHTENSHKFSLDQIESILKDTNLEKLEMWFDSRNYFALVLAKKL